MRTSRRLVGLLMVASLATALSACALLRSGPEARFDISPIVVYAGEIVELDAGASTATASIVSYTWHFGDGATSAGQVVTTTFDTAGAHTVELTVRDAGGRSDTATEEIIVYVRSGTVLLEEDFADGEEALGRWPLDPTWATAGDASVDQIAADPGYALYIHSSNSSWHRRYRAITLPPLRVGQHAVFSCRIMTVQNQDEHTFLFSPARRELDSIAGSLPYVLFTGTGDGSYVREPTEYGDDVPRPIPFLPDVYRWHTYTFDVQSGAYELRIDGSEMFKGSLTASFDETTEWILLIGEESLTEACRAYFDDIRVSIEE